jgi:hypothetical protein
MNPSSFSVDSERLRQLAGSVAAAADRLDRIAWSVTTAGGEGLADVRCAAAYSEAHQAIRRMGSCR